MSGVCAVAEKAANNSNKKVSLKICMLVFYFEKTE
jgi:hypothetical protein